MKREAVLRAILLATATALLAGCGGISGSHSVSPATFLLPGLMKIEPKRSPVEPPKPETAEVTPAPAPVFSAITQN